MKAVQRMLLFYSKLRGFGNLYIVPEFNVNVRIFLGSKSDYVLEMKPVVRCVVPVSMPVLLTSSLKIVNLGRVMPFDVNERPARKDLGMVWPVQRRPGVCRDSGSRGGARSSVVQRKRVPRGGVGCLA